MGSRTCPSTAKVRFPVSDQGCDAATNTSSTAIFKSAGFTLYPVNGTEPDGGSQTIFTSSLGTVTTNQSLQTLTVGLTWSPTWSCNYKGLVYFDRYIDATNPDTVVFTLPPNITAWSGVIEPFVSADRRQTVGVRSFVGFNVVATASDGTTLTQRVDTTDISGGGGKLAGFAFFNGVTILTVAVVPDPDSYVNGFAIAQIQISDSVVCTTGIPNVCTTSQIIKG